MIYFSDCTLDYSKTTKITYIHGITTNYYFGIIFWHQEKEFSLTWQKHNEIPKQLNMCQYYWPWTSVIILQKDSLVISWIYIYIWRMLHLVLCNFMEGWLCLYECFLGILEALSFFMFLFWFSIKAICLHHRLGQHVTSVYLDKTLDRDF